jgi:esterase/lipase superfamily enzyme
MQAEDASQEITVESLDVLTRERWREEIRRRAVPLGKPGILVFVHGFNVGFADAAKRAAQLAYDLAFPGPVVFFSWPSRGQVLDYTADGDAAEWSIPHLSDVLADLADLADGAPIYIVAHSMGNRVLTRAFHALVTQNAAKSNAFKEIVLTAPDIDADIFRTQIAPKILGAGPRTTLYASDTDKALTTSRSLHGGYQRLGQAGASLVILPGMETVDATSITTDFLSHSYFGDSTTVMADLFHLIRKGLPPSARTALQPATSPAGQYWRFKP